LTPSFSSNKTKSGTIWESGLTPSTFILLCYRLRNDSTMMSLSRDPGIHDVSGFQPN
jgi:hypothetical protein